MDTPFTIRPGWTLETARVFMIHSGGDSQRLPCQSVTGKAWSTLPTCNKQHELDAPVDLLLQSLFDLFVDVAAGLVVASSDVLLLIPPGFRPTWPAFGATGLAIPTEKSLGPNHGVYQVGAGGDAVHVVDKFWQKATVPELTAAGAVRPDDTVLIDTGVRALKKRGRAPTMHAPRPPCPPPTRSSTSPRPRRCGSRSWRRRTPWTAAPTWAST